MTLLWYPQYNVITLSFINQVKFLSPNYCMKMHCDRTIVGVWRQSCLSYGVSEDLCFFLYCIFCTPKNIPCNSWYSICFLNFSVFYWSGFYIYIKKMKELLKSLKFPMIYMNLLKFQMIIKQFHYLSWLWTNGAKY